MRTDVGVKVHRFIFVPLVCILLLLRSTAVGAGAVITCTVSIAEPAPFTIELTSSAIDNTVEEGEEFKIVATIKNFDPTRRIRRATARIDFDASGLELLKPKQVQNRGTLTRKNAGRKSVWWELEGEEEGTYVVQVTISGVNEAGNLVVTQSSINIRVVESSSTTNASFAFLENYFLKSYNKIVEKIQ